MWQALSATLLLGEFVTGPLGVEEEQWEDIAPADLRSQVQLSQLQSLYLALEKKMHGSRLDLSGAIPE